MVKQSLRTNKHIILYCWIKYSVEGWTILYIRDSDPDLIPDEPKWYIGDKDGVYEEVHTLKELHRFIMDNQVNYFDIPKEVNNLIIHHFKLPIPLDIVEEHDLLVAFWVEANRTRISH